jgi:carbamoyltransferase
VALPHSLGVVYAAFTGRYLGFGPFDEYKVMGLAAHGRPRYLDVFRRIVRSDGGGRFWVDRGYFAFEYQGVLGRRVTRELGPARPPRAELEQRHADVAASLQERLGEIGVEVATALRRRTGARRLCLAGGVALNGVMNARIVAEAGYDDVWIQPAAGDAGCALGAALHVWTEVLGQARRSVMEHAYLGPEWSDEEVAAELRGVRAPYRHCDDIAGAVAELVADGKVVGWFQGRMEWGPRALGNRSIVADPRRPEMQERVNRCIKQRESFRPFAPAVLAARAGEWFETARASPFMLLVVPVRAERRGAIPAVTHVDGTARVQTVDERHNPRFGALLRAFERRTGVPVLLNTSFNVQGEPIVCRPIEAVRCFYGSGMDALAIGRCLVVKGEAG